MLTGIVSCRHNPPGAGEDIITVSIEPFRYFVEGIAGDDFTVNVMVQPGANPHIYEPYPDQIRRLQRSRAYISNGYLGFEMAWLEKFYEINKTMVKLSLGDRIDPILAGEHHHHHHNHAEHVEGADPHYWVSPECALIMASSVKELLCSLNPGEVEKYDSNYRSLLEKIKYAERMADSLFSQTAGSTFMIYHPTLAYLARDYNLTEVAVEFEGKEPPPSRLKELIDLAREKQIRTIFVQKEYDSRNAAAIAREIGATVTVIDPLSGEWLASTLEIITELHRSFTE